LRILVVQNSRTAPIGLLGDYLDEFGANLVTITPPEGEALPANAGGFHGAVVLGGPQSAADDGTSPYIPRLLDLMRAFADANRPILGICLGAQLLARAHGERVYKHSLMERGFKPVTSTPAGAADPVMGALGPVLHIMQWHYDTFELPKDAVLLATGPDCANQAFRLGDSQYGLQFHPEVNAEIIRDWVSRAEGATPDEVAAIGREMEAQIGRHLPEAASFARNWLDLVRRKSVGIGRHAVEAAGT
jgi:GMP synthase-like glutamine amidotransferase